MKKLIDPINTADGLFHPKNKETGEKATIVTADYMNNTQSATRINQQELISILTAAEIVPDEATSNQVLTALQKLFLAIDNSRVSNALQKGNNLSDVEDAATSRKNLDLDKVGNYAAVQQGGGTGMEGNKVYVGWDGEKLIVQVDSTAMGELFYEGNPPTASQTDALPTKGGDLTGVVTTSDEIRSTHDNNFRMVNGDRGIFWRLDGSDLYLMKTASGDQYGSYDESRPMRVDLASGTVYINDTQPYSQNNCPFPVGYVMLMGNNTDPNGLYPGTTWEFLNNSYDGRVIALGQDPLGTGGSNSVTLSANNLPDHSHQSGWGAPGAAYANDLRTGTDNTGTYSRSYTASTFTDSQNGQGVANAAFSVQNEFVHFQGWLRTA